MASNAKMSTYYVETRLRTVRWAKVRIMQTIYHQALQMEFECTVLDCNDQGKGDCHKCGDKKP